MTRVALRERIAAHGQLVGILLRAPAEPLIELAGLTGFDFVVLDCEHGPADALALYHHLLAADAAGVALLVRVAGDTGSEVLRALDLGAAGVVVPHVDGAPAARRAVRQVHYPPTGSRGLATYTRAGDYGLVPTDRHLANAARSYVVAMVEDAAGVEQAEQICAVEGIDAVFVGPADLACALGVPGQARDPQVLQASAQVHAAARSAGRDVMVIVSNPSAAADAFEAGATLVVYNGQAALGALFTELRAARPR